MTQVKISKSPRFINRICKTTLIKNIRKSSTVREMSLVKDEISITIKPPKKENSSR